MSGSAAHGPAGTPIKLYWRDVTPDASGPLNVIDNAATVGADGTWHASIPNVNYSHFYEVYAKYDVYASRPCRYTGGYTISRCETNFAAPSNGATVAASSQYNASYPASAVNNGDRKGLNWGAGGGWGDATANAYPDWVQVNFQGDRAIHEISVLTLQDNYGSPAEPTEAMTFTSYGITAFDIQYWTGSSWATIPGASVSGNNKVWRKFTFAPVTTRSIRVLVNNALFSYSRITEVEAPGW